MIFVFGLRAARNTAAVIVLLLFVLFVAACDETSATAGGAAVAPTGEIAAVTTAQTEPAVPTVGAADVTPVPGQAAKLAAGDAPTPTPVVTATPLPLAAGSIASEQEAYPGGAVALPSPVPEVGEPYLASPYPGPETKPTEPPVYGYRVINRYSHDPQAFTQGLIYDDGLLLEGTGRYGASSLREVVLETGEVLRQQPLEEIYFGEGITLFDGEIIQLTWQSGTGFIYDRETFDRLSSFSYPTQGWGITHDGEKLIMSDGSATLYFWDPQTLAETGRVTVTANGEPVVRLNELEYINGEVFANIWQTDMIARISPETGEVLGWIDLSGLLDEEQAASADVLNGIAYDATGDRLFVTGKYWPLLFEIELVPPQPAAGQ